MPTTRSSASDLERAAAPSSTTNKKEFRCNFMHCLLTYGGFRHGEITKETVADQLLSKGDAERYRICIEKYTEPSDPTRPFHVHAAIRYKKKINTKKTAPLTGNETLDDEGRLVPDGKCHTPFDIVTSAGRIVHANIKTHDPKKVSSKKRRLSTEANETLSERSMFLYVAKGEQPKEEWEAEHENGPNYGSNADFIEGGDVLSFLQTSLDALAHKRSRKETFAAVANAKTVAEGMDILWKHEPEQALKYGPTIEVSLRRRIGGYDAKRFDLRDFDRPPLDLSKAVLLPGRSGVGKTQFAKAHGDHPLVVRTMDRLKQITSNTSHLVFDDMNFGPGTKEKPGLNFTPEQMIALLDIEETTTVKTRPQNRGDDATIPAGMPRIFTTNIDVDGQWMDEDTQELDANGDTLHPFPRGANPEQQEAIDRRHHLENYVEAPLYDKRKALLKRFVAGIMANVVKSCSE